MKFLNRKIFASSKVEAYQDIVRTNTNPGAAAELRQSFQNQDRANCQRSREKRHIPISRFMLDLLLYCSYLN